MSEFLMQAVDTLTQLERIEQRQREAGDATADLYSEASRKCETRIAELSSQPEVDLALRIELNDFSSSVKDLEFFRESGLIEPESFTRHQDVVEDMRQRPVLRLAARVLGGLSLSQLISENGTSDETTITNEIDKALFFNRRPESVADDLIGLRLRHKDKQGVILDTLPNDETDNARWIDSRPLFGLDPVDVYVAPYRGSHMLFFRTAPDTCVRIDQIELGGEKFVRPGQVSKALGLDSETSLGVELDNETVIIK